jgi:hypothetical protein
MGHISLTLSPKGPSRNPLTVKNSVADHKNIKWTTDAEGCFAIVFLNKGKTNDSTAEYKLHKNEMFLVTYEGTKRRVDKNTWDYPDQQTKKIDFEYYYLLVCINRCGITKVVFVCGDVEDGNDSDNDCGDNDSHSTEIYAADVDGRLVSSFDFNFDHDLGNGVASYSKLLEFLQSEGSGLMPASQYDQPPWHSVISALAQTSLPSMVFMKRNIVNKPRIIVRQ